MGFYLGIGGVVTFKNAKKIKEVVQMAPMERILLETDSPYLAPVPYRGKRNSSLYLPYVVQEIAELKGISEEEVIETTEKNSGGPDRDSHGRCEPHGTCLVSCAGVSVWRVHLHGGHCGVPADV